MKFRRGGLVSSSSHAGEADSAGTPYFFLDGNVDHDPAVKQLQQALIQKLPAIRDHIRRRGGDESLLTDYVDRLYRRLRKAVKVVEINDAEIWSRLVSIVHEERRRERQRFDFSTDAGEIEELVDPNAEEFEAELIHRDQLRAFRECLDDWTRQVFDVRFSSPVSARSKDLAKRFGMTTNAFDQRWRRGINAGLAKYRRRYT